jgi:hypothetical protein
MYHNARFHPSRVGKLSMAAAWLGLLGLVVIPATQSSSFGLLYYLVYFVVTISITLGFYAAIKYAYGRD